MIVDLGSGLHTSSASNEVYNEWSLGQSKLSGHAQSQNERGLPKRISHPRMSHWDPPMRQSTAKVESKKPLICNIYISDDTLRTCYLERWDKFKL